MSPPKPPKRRRLTAGARRDVIEAAAREVFTERGYHGASIDEIARRSGVTPPVLYDHFPSKLALHRRLLERTRDELLAMWRETLAGDDPAAVRIPRAFDAWARYVQANPYAPKVFFFETTGDPEAEAIHREVRDHGTAMLAVLMRSETDGALPPDGDGHLAEMASEVLRSGLAGLAVWWTDHPDVPREQIVMIAMNLFWVGLERVTAGELWAAAP